MFSPIYDSVRARAAAIQDDVSSDSDSDSDGIDQQRAPHKAQQPAPRQAPAKQQNIPIGMGCWMTPDASEVSTRVQLDTLFSEPGNSLVSGSAVNLRVKDTRFDKGPNGASNASMSSKWSDYKPSTYSSYPGASLDSDRRKSTGILVNAYTGKLYETFENEPPPPTRDYSIPAEQLKKSNFRLIQAQGGYDNNARTRHKTEVHKEMPGEGAGPNVWGDQLYADRRRQEMQTRVMRDVWGNRNGIFTDVESVDDRAPVGYVGYVNTLRPMPYLPATHRTDLYSHGRAGNAQPEQMQDPGWHMMKPQVTTKKPVYDENRTRVPGPDGTSTMAPGTAIMDRAVMNLPGTQRSITGSRMVMGAVDATAYSEAPTLLESGINALRTTLKSVMDLMSFGTGNAAAEETGYVPVIDTDARATQKTMMDDHAFDPANVATESVGYVPVMDTDARATQKTLMAQMFPVTTATDGISTMTGYVPVIDTDARATQKTLMAQMFPVTTATDGMSTMTGYVPVIDTDARATQKTMMAQMFPVYNANDTSAGAVIDAYQGDLQETRRLYYEDTVKGPFVNGATDVGTYVGYDGVQLDPYRGHVATFYTAYAGVPLAGGETSNYRPVTEYVPRETERGFPKSEWPLVAGADNPYMHDGGGALLTTRMFLDDDGGVRALRPNMETGYTHACPEDMNAADYYAPPITYPGYV